MLIEDINNQCPFWSKKGPKLGVPDGQKICVFCKIINREIPSKIVYEDDELIAFEDIAPIAPVHILIVPKNHIEALTDLNEDNSKFISKIYLVANKIAEEKE